MERLIRPFISSPTSWLSFLLIVVLMLALSQSFASTVESPQTVDEEFPELDDIREIVNAEQPEGVVFLVMDYDTEAYFWVLPRLERYVQMLRKKWPDLPLVFLSHGDEIFSLLVKNEVEYASFHRTIRELVTIYNVDIQVCGAYAALSGVDESEFADFVDVVPSAPAQITDYREMDYQVLSLEPTW